MTREEALQICQDEAVYDSIGSNYVGLDSNLFDAMREAYRRGYEAAREQAAGIANPGHESCPCWSCSDARRIRDKIRTMQPESGADNSPQTSRKPKVDNETK